MQSLAQLVGLLGLAAPVLAAPSSLVQRAQTVYLAGDSTMAKTTGATQGASLLSSPFLLP